MWVVSRIYLLLSVGEYRSKIGENEVMNDTEIIAKAPPNTSIVDSKFKFFDDVYCELNEQGEWNWKDTMPSYPIRSLIDIKKIAELEAFNQEQGQLMSAMTEYYEDDKGVAFQSHNLEQQAKGLIDYAEALYMNIKRGKYHQLMIAAGRLQIEAKALKEAGKGSLREHIKKMSAIIETWPQWKKDIIETRIHNGKVRFEEGKE
jgi:hypothetical protein